MVPGSIRRTLKRDGSEAFGSIHLTETGHGRVARMQTTWTSQRALRIPTRRSFAIVAKTTLTLLPESHGCSGTTHRVFGVTVHTTLASMLSPKVGAILEVLKVHVGFGDKLERALGFGLLGPSACCEIVQAVCVGEAHHAGTIVIIQATLIDLRQKVLGFLAHHRREERLVDCGMTEADGDVG